jgi:hypothetical protein
MSFFMRLVVNILLVLLSVATGAVFLYSAYTKLFPIQPFEYTLVEYLHLPWGLVPFASRLLIGLEAALGAMMVLHFFGNKNTVLKCALALTIIFSLYLVALWAFAGNNVNCGCFGDAIWMSPSASLIKNAVILMVLAILIRFHKGFHFNRNGIVIGMLLLAGLATPFFLYPLSPGQPTWLRIDRYKMNFNEVYREMGRDTTVASFPDPVYSSDFDLTHGKHIIAFLSPHCGHCRIAARKMHLMKKNNPGLPFFFIIGGKSDLTDFWAKTNAQDVPHTRLDGEPFLQYTGGVFPLIIWVNDGWVEAKADYNTLTQAEVEKWVQTGSK